ncbi:MAG TPA: hypothetical protein VF708_01630 [Pyrinomonadaceae bacterium]|jgi:hypothetical protein
MKQIITIVVIVIAIAATWLVSGQNRRGTGGSSGAEQQRVLYDFRRLPQIKQPVLTPVERRKILSAVFSSYLKSADECKSVDESSGDYLAAARKAGQIVPDVVSMATGSFTASGERQMAYIISVSECNASHADNFGTKRLAIFSGEKLVADVDTDFQRRILRTLDLNSDGVNELLLVGGDINQGIAVDVASLVDFQAGQLRTIKDFKMIREDACESGLSDSNVRASVIHYSVAVKGQMPEFRVENYRARCLSNGRLGKWTFLSSGEMTEQ